ncbi:MAG: SDR family NAD(P)-dependent oxidoreductase, partial [Halanaerobiaceae bacterium]
MRLEGKCALVTGGSRGIGKGIALALARNGVHVAINYHSNHKRAEDTLTALKELNINAVKLQADITEVEEVK